MHIVVNHFTLQDGVDWSALEAAVEDLQARVSRDLPAFRGVSLVRVSGGRAIFLVRFADLESLNDISRNVAAPWFAEHFKPFLAGPVERQVGEIVAGDLR